MAETYSVSLEKLIEQMELENVTSDVDVSRIDIVQTDVNRPALQLAGFFDYFDSGRIQIIGHVEHTYMEQKGLDYTLEMMEIIMAGSERLRASCFAVIFILTRSWFSLPANIRCLFCAPRRRPTHLWQRSSAG